MSDCRGDRMLAMKRAVIGLSAALALCASTHLTIAANPASGITSRQARDEATRALPLANADPLKRARIMKVVQNTTLYRRLPTQVIECDPSYYLFLVENPEVIVNIWRELGISEVKLTRLAENQLQADDGAGTSGAVEIMHRSHDTHLFYAEGKYDGPLIKTTLRGECVLLLRTSYVRETNGKYYITCRLDSFVRLDNATLDVLVRVVQPLVGQVADHNFRETVQFVGGLHHAAETNLAGVQELTDRLQDLKPETRKEFGLLNERLAVNAAIARAEAAARQTPAAGASRTTQRPAPQQR